MKKYVYLFSLFIFFVFLSFEKSPTPSLKEISPAVPLLQLKWNKAYNDDTIDKSIIGLKWALSYVGAQLPTSEIGISYSENIITIDSNKLGFSENAQNKLSVLYTKILASEEYKVNKSIDLGRYVTLLLGASEHYYAISETPRQLKTILNNYTLKSEKGYVANSTVSLSHRSIQFSEQNGFNQLFLSEEIDSISGTIYEYETIELLPNGQLRFGVFDANGNRKNSANSLHSSAGKPAKCMWCHESVINQMFKTQKDFPNYIPFTDFQNKLIGYRSSHHNLKIKLRDGVDFTQTQQHTLTEFLYITFMEPSPERLSLEWNLPLAEVQKMLLNSTTHVNEEFPFLGILYDRNYIEKMAPLKGLEISSSVRELSNVEVNHLN